MDDIIQKVEAVTADDIIEVANRVFDKKQLSQIVFKGN
jgi:predicted Zn-dependent peptidase